MQQQIQTSGRELVEKFWQDQMEAHPRIFAVLNIVKEILVFFFGGHVIPWFLFTMLTFSSRVADGILMGAAIWITAINVSPTFMTGFVGGPVQADNLSSLSLLSFSLLPELITVAALVITIKHIITFCKRRELNNFAWLWATLYAIPTGTFLTMTIWTITTFVTKGQAGQITGALLVVRCLAAWGYSFVEILYFALGKDAMIEADDKSKLQKSLNEVAENLKNATAELDAEKVQSAESLQKITAELERERAEFRSQLSALVAELDVERLRKMSAERELEARNSASTSAEDPQQPAKSSAPTPAEKMRNASAEKEVRNSGKVLEMGDRRAAIETRNAKILKVRNENSALSNRDIAAEIGCDEKTVRMFLRKIDEAKAAELPQISHTNSAPTPAEKQEPTTDAMPVIVPEMAVAGV